MMDKIEFVLFGLDLLEPMAFVTNMLVMLSCLYGYYRTKNVDSAFGSYWRLFFISFALASFFGGLSHVFWNYWWFYGKILPWFFGVVSTSFAALAMLEARTISPKAKSRWQLVIFLKALLVLVLAYSQWSFLFVAIDTILTLLGFAGIYGVTVMKQGYPSVRFVVYGVLVLLPSAFIFLLKYDLHRWMNREDLSHILMVIAIQLFAISVLRHKESVTRTSLG